MSSFLLNMTKVSVVGKIAVAGDHKLVIYTCVGVLIACSGMHPHTHKKNIAVLASTSITVYNQLCSSCFHLLEVRKSALTNFV